MTVCRFFQQGYCRYGQNCRYDHIFGSKYTYHANSTQQAVAQQPAGFTDDQLVTQVQTDVQSALQGRQWILSCYSPFKERPVFPGIKDLSPEEARLFIYEAKATNNLEQAVNYINNLIKETRQKYERLLQPDANIIKVLRSLYKGEMPVSPFSNADQNTFGATNNSASIFRSAAQNMQQGTQNTAASVFSQGSNSIFGSKSDPAKDLFSNANNTNMFGSSSAPTNIFGSPSSPTSPAKSIFASALQNTNNQFNAANQTSPSNLFAAANQSIFGSPTNENNSPFNQISSNSPSSQSNWPFGQGQNNWPYGETQTNSSQPTQNPSPFNQGNVFQKTESPAAIFGQAYRQLEDSSEPGVYSKIEELTDADLEAFKSDMFELGFVPEVPPPYQLCSRA